MSNFAFANCSLQPSMLLATDEQTMPNHHAYNKGGRDALRLYGDGILWTRSRTFGATDSTLGLLVGTGEFSGAWGVDNHDAGGCQSQFKYLLQTQDSGGSPLPNVVCQVFVTATDAYVGEFVSDLAGNVTLFSPYPSPTTHYVVCYLAGSPDRAGTSVNTLVFT